MSKLKIKVDDLANNPSTRLPVCLLLDTSSSMEGPRIDALNEGVKMFKKTVCSDELLKLSAEICIITFGNEGFSIPGDIQPEKGVKKIFELERKEGKKCKLEVERIEKEIIELKDKKLKLKDKKSKLTDEDEIDELEDEITELEDEIENQKDTIKEEKDEMKDYLKEMTKLKTMIDNTKSDKKHALKKSVINYVNNIVHQEDEELIVGVDHMRVRF